MGTHILQDMQSLTISVYISTALVKQFTASEKYDKIIQNRSVYSKKGDGKIPPISMESQPQNPEFKNNSENFYPCILQYLNVFPLFIDMDFSAFIHDVICTRNLNIEIESPVAFLFSFCIDTKTIYIPLLKEKATVMAN